MTMAPPSTDPASGAGGGARSVPAAAPVRPRRSLASRRRLLVAVAIVVGAIGVLLYQGLSNATTYFYTADQAVAHRAVQGTRTFRIEGIVMPGTVHVVDATIQFQIENNGVQVPVVHSGGQPELFQPNIPVVLQGRWNGDSFASDLIMVKHTESYRQQNPGRVQAYKS
jgi:cytochrome c-type biogenesis protein CcmE